MHQLQTEYKSHAYTLRHRMQIIRWVARPMQAVTRRTASPPRGDSSMFPNVPPAILPFIQDPPLLKGESRQEYYDLLAALIAEIAPVDTVEWLLVIDYANCIWEIRHNRRSKTFLIDLQRTKDLNMMASLPYDECEEYLANSKTDPDFFRRHGTDARSMAATAFVKAAPKLELIDKSLERSQRRADKVIEKLEC